MNSHIDIQTACSEPVPEEEDLRNWLHTTLQGRAPSPSPELCLRLVGEDEMAHLNQSYRGRQGPTNVLSFPADLPEGLGLALLGDIVICAPVVAREAAAQGKSLQAHWAHMAVHGALHLLGYDHIAAAEAAEMEALETAILATLGFPCPYPDTVSEEPVTP
jgi:probable rRNA maturation factor